jgi:hypothetical protein
MTDLPHVLRATPAVIALVAMAYALTMSACTPPPPTQQLDQCERQQAFERCLAAVPSGPVVMHENGDWADVVDECDDYAASTAYRDPRVIPPACKDHR